MIRRVSASASSSLDWSFRMFHAEGRAGLGPDTRKEERTRTRTVPFTQAAPSRRDHADVSNRPQVSTFRTARLYYRRRREKK